MSTQVPEFRPCGHTRVTRSWPEAWLFYSVLCLQPLAKPPHSLYIYNQINHFPQNEEHPIPNFWWLSVSSLCMPTWPTIIALLSEVHQDVTCSASCLMMLDWPCSLALQPSQNANSFSKTASKRHVHRLSFIFKHVHQKFISAYPFVCIKRCF